MRNPQNSIGNYLSPYITLWGFEGSEFKEGEGQGCWDKGLVEFGSIRV